jgi:hypothetical protein
MTAVLTAHSNRSHPSAMVKSPHVDLSNLLASASNHRYVGRKRMGCDVEGRWVAIPASVLLWSCDCHTSCARPRATTYSPQDGKNFVNTDNFQAHVVNQYPTGHRYGSSGIGGNSTSVGVSATQHHLHSNVDDPDTDDQSPADVDASFDAAVPVSQQRRRFGVPNYQKRWLIVVRPGSRTDTSHIRRSTHRVEAHRF